MAAVRDPEPEVLITPYRDGPLLVRGPFRMRDQDGGEIAVDRETVALCRCGRSRSKPFCDGTHRVAGWSAPSGAEPGPRGRSSGPAFDGDAGIRADS